MQKDALVPKVIQQYGLSELQSILINRYISRLLQSKHIRILSDGSVGLSEEEQKKYGGIQNNLQIEFQELERAVTDFMAAKVPKGAKIISLIIENLLTLSAEIVRRNTPNHLPTKEGEVFLTIQTILSSTLTSDLVSTVLEELAQIVSNSRYAQHVVAAELCTALVASDSPQLVAALGGYKGLNVYIDTSVAIPLVCGLLFDGVNDRAIYSAQLLNDLMKERKFTAYVPESYLGEIAGHLIDAGRYYKDLLDLGEDLRYSGNAFISHYSQYKAQLPNANLGFEEYLEAFGIAKITHLINLSDSSFYAERDRLVRNFWRLFERYGIKIVAISPHPSRDAVSRFRKSAPQLVNSRPDVLVEHDAAVIEYLESPVVEAGVAKVLCTWDVAHERYNQNWTNYCVLTPVAITDLFAVVREPSSHRPIAQLVDFIRLQSDKALQLSAKVWDEIVRVEKSGLADATLLRHAREFRQEYLTRHAGEMPVNGSVQQSWVRWKLEH